MVVEEYAEFSCQTRQNNAFLCCISVSCCKQQHLKLSAGVSEQHDVSLRVCIVGCQATVLRESKAYQIVLHFRDVPVRIVLFRIRLNQAMVSGPFSLGPAHPPELCLPIVAAKMSSAVFFVPALSKRSAGADRSENDLQCLQILDCLCSTVSRRKCENTSAHFFVLFV